MHRVPLFTGTISTLLSILHHKTTIAPEMRCFLGTAGPRSCAKSVVGWSRALQPRSQRVAEDFSSVSRSSSFSSTSSWDGPTTRMETDWWSRVHRSGTEFRMVQWSEECPILPTLISPTIFTVLAVPMTARRHRHRPINA